MEWMAYGNDCPMLVTKIHKSRYIGPSFKASTTENMKHVTLRHNDVIVCSYPKCGSHWVWENVRMLLTGTTAIDNLQKEQLMMELLDNPEDLDSLSSPRVFNNHAYFDDQPADILKGVAKVIIVYRNPKDVCLSYYYQHSRNPTRPYKGGFSNYIQRFLHGKLAFGDYFEYLNLWERGLSEHSKVQYILMSYEDLLQNPISERKRLATFLDRDYDVAFFQAVTQATCIDVMRNQKDDVSEKNIDGEAVMFRKGKIGNWKEVFSVTQSEMFDEIVEKLMGRSEMFTFVYELNT